MLDILTQEELEIIREDVADALSDHQFENPIIYRRLVSRTVNTGSGAVTLVYDDVELHAVRGDMTAHSVANSGGRYQIGDEWIMFSPSLLEATPRPDDIVQRLITEAGDIKLVQGSAAIVGYNTYFMADGVLGGDQLYVPLASGVTNASIKGTVMDDEAATLKAVWPDDDLPAAEFKIYRTYSIVQRIVDPLKAACRLVVRRMGS